MLRIILILLWVFLFLSSSRSVFNKLHPPQHSDSCFLRISKSFAGEWSSRRLGKLSVQQRLRQLPYPRTQYRLHLLVKIPRLVLARSERIVDKHCLLTKFPTSQKQCYNDYRSVPYSSCGEELARLFWVNRTSDDTPISCHGTSGTCWRQFSAWSPQNQMFAFGPGQQAFRFPITSNLHLTPARISCSFVDAVPRSIYGGVADLAFGRDKFSLHAP